jgi:membrane-associated phospholipid phosphatase
LARLVSILAHPFVLVVLLLLLPRLEKDVAGAIRTSISVVAIVIFPLALLIWRSYSSGQWKTVDASSKTDRPLLYVTVLIALVVLAFYFYHVEHSQVLVRGVLITFCMIAVALVLNRWIKVSLHLAFASYCAVLLATVDLRYGLPILLLLPLLAWSRLVLSRHSMSEVLGGSALGLLAAGCFLCLPW